MSAPQPAGRRSPQRHRSRARTSAAALPALTAVLTAVVTVVASGGGAAAGTGTPTPGRQSAGDPVFAYLGNGGYDVGSYDVRYDYRPGTTTMDSSVRITATATQALSSFSLDSAVERINAVSVQGEPAAFRVSGEKLVITPKRPLRKGSSFRVDVSYRVDRSRNPQSPAYPPDEKPHFDRWIDKTDGFALMGQPDRAHMFFPGNDVPSDKARVTFRITTPKDLQAVANGTLRSRTTNGDRTTYVYTTRDPIPTHVAQAAVGHFTEVKGRGPHGLPLRSYLATDQYQAATPRVRDIPAQMAWLEKQIGRRFPYETYGVLGVSGDYDGVALEAPTLSSFSVKGLSGSAQDDGPTMVHELAHQYFGDAVSVADWDEMWISEGHATYYEFLYSVAKGYVNLDEGLRRRYEFDGEQRAECGPPGRLKTPRDVLSGTNIAGMLMLYGLRQQVGDAAFRRIEQTFFDRYRDKSATTQDYIDVANKVTGRDLTSYIKGWIYGPTTPPLPGHPDWKPAAPPKSS